MKGLEKTAMVLSALGAIDLGLSAFGFELVSKINVAYVPEIIFIIVGLSGIWALVKVFK